MTRNEKVELIERNRGAISENLIEMYKEVAENDGRCQYQLYIWSDGKVERLYEVQGSHCWLQPRDSESRELIWVDTIELPCFCWEDFAGQSIPDRDEEPEQYEQLRQETIEWLVSEYDPSEAIDNCVARIDRESVDEDW